MRQHFDSEETDPSILTCVITQEEIEAGAKAWLHWQFGRDWDSATEPMREKFREGARSILMAAACARITKKI